MVDSRDSVEEIRNRINILDVISEYVTLKRAGKSYKGLCPFHTEKTSSFNVSEEFQSWHCFGCGEHGDVFSFLMKIENLTFAEVLERLAKKTGVELKRSNDRQTSRRELLSRINSLAAAYYAALLKRTPIAAEYLRSRGLADQTIDEFRLGYAAPAWDGLTRFLTDKKVEPTDAAQAGLLIKGERGYYDRFRHRIVFPILDIQERIIGFGGRAVASDDEPKYLNSPETPLFNKTRALYGLNSARKKIAAEDQALVVEGYTDVIAAHQAGFVNCVATLGTALTLEHTKVLSRYTKKIVLAYDSDSAGMKAALRGAAMFMEAEFDVRIVRLPKGDDPDSILRRGATAEFASAISDALPIVDYRLDLLAEEHDVSTPAGRSAMLKAAVHVLAEIPSTLERERYIRSIAVGRNHPNWETGRIAENDIRREIDEVLRRTAAGGHRVAAPAGAAVPGKPAAVRLGSAERSVLSALIHGSESTEMLVAAVSSDDFAAGAGREAAAAVLDMIGKQGAVNVPDLLETLGAEAGSIITDLAVSSDEGPPLTQEWLSGCAESMKRNLLKRVRTHDVLEPYIKQGIIETGDIPREQLRAFLRESGRVSNENAREGKNDSDS